MKKSYLLFLLVALVLISTGFWYFNSRNNFHLTDLVQFGVIILILIFALFVGIKRLGSEKRGEPVEDELSKMILQKSAALSYYISLYMWVFMIWLKDRVAMDTEEVLGSGILAMAVIFGLSWVFVRFIGLKNG